MYNWKLSALFVIGLMMILGVFNKAVMASANDGRGTVTVAWYDRDITSDTIVGASNTDTPLNAGSTHNILQFTYTAQDSDNNAINMAGGRVQIRFPSGWKVSNKLIQVQDGNDVVYQTDSMGNLDTDNIFIGEDLDTDEKKAKADATVTFEADRRITVNLSSEWSSSRSNAARELVIILSDVTAPIPSRLPETDDENEIYVDYANDYATISFQCSSSARNGTLSRLSDTVEVKVGNILGNRDLATDLNEDGEPDDPETRDPLIREFKVTPARVFTGDENISVQIVFEAPGPMYGSDLDITIPPALQASQASDITVSGRGGATIGDTSNITVNPTIPINTIDRGQRVIVSYRIATVGDVSGHRESVTATTTLTSTAGAKVTGGVVSATAGSGRMDISPTFVEASSPRRDITLTYTAYTKLENVDIEINPEGIVIDSSDQALQKTSSSDYGYVSGSRSSANLDVTNNIITWENITLEKNKTLRTTIRRVNISQTAGNYSWTVKVGPTGDTLQPIEDDLITNVDERPVLSVVRTSGDAVRFEIASSENIFPAGSQETIVFRFIADSTPIRDGRVSLIIPPALGSAPTTAKDTDGRVTATSDGTLAADQPTVSGRTVNVAIKQLEVGETVTIKYGTDEDDKASEKAVLHYAANDAVRVSGTFRVSSSASTRSAGSVTLKLTNIADGTGSATLVPTSIAAGSNNQAIEVVFTAAGTMNGGQVSLEIPSGWGAMQEDPTKRNYVTVRGSVSALDVGSSRAIATIRTLSKGDSFRFIYGGGTSSVNNGVEVQTGIGTAQFTIKSDGDGDEVFKLVTSNVEHEGREKIRNPKKLGRIYADAPGVLQIEVSGALDGTGMATVNPTEVSAAANDVQLVFTYTPSQTIVDGALRFTVPAGWSKPQVDELGSPGYTEVDGLGLGSSTDDDKSSITVPIFSLDNTQTVRIIYGATDTGRAVAATTTGTNSFRIEIQGHEGGSLTAIQRQPSVSVTGQGSGGGKAIITVRPVSGDTSLYAGDTNRTLTIAYTAAGQMVDGRIRLTIPPDWSAPSASTLIVRPSASTRYDGRMVVVEGVNLNANSTMNFIYTGDVQPTVETDVTFVVAVHSGLAGDSFAEVSGDDTMLTVDVQEARRGSGSGVVTPTTVKAGATGVNLTFTYTAVGEISGPREFRVQVPSSWTPPSNAVTAPENKGTYRVVHRHGGVETRTSVEKLAPVGRDMVARVRLGGLEVEAGDQIIFTYENADAPAASEVSAFRIVFDGRQIQDNTQVRVGTGTPPAPRRPRSPHSHRYG